MKLASRSLVGTHDFRNLCKMDVGNGVTAFVRSILDIEIVPCYNNYISEGIYTKYYFLNFNKTSNFLEYDMYVITIKGQAFLWHQIRCIMGILLLIGQNKEEPSLTEELLDIEKNTRYRIHIYFSQFLLMTQF